ncbi:hypothetical protein C7M84_016404 [Penaeus vannamei]|uniref:Ig-like domain-containing protein n=1 Tax=Penaeus vannamei TaxID=6689 RepID=A0A423SN57_PENVA|nr:hypothetical protein C7M84_016404 [Penaeus vannamei]
MPGAPFRAPSLNIQSANHSLATSSADCLFSGCSAEARSAPFVPDPPHQRLSFPSSGAAAELAVGPVSLGDGQHIIAYDEGPSPENSLIRCPYDLQEGQQVVAVIWELLQDGKRAGSFKWRPGRGGTTTGILRGKVNARREDSDLELTSVEYDLAGLYSCTVKTDDGERGNAKADILTAITKAEAENPLNVCTLTSLPRIFPFPYELHTSRRPLKSVMDAHDPHFTNWTCHLEKNIAVESHLPSATVCSLTASRPDLPAMRYPAATAMTELKSDLTQGRMPRAPSGRGGRWDTERGGLGGRERAWLGGRERAWLGGRERAWLGGRERGG